MPLPQTRFPVVSFPYTDSAGHLFVRRVLLPLPRGWVPFISAVVSSRPLCEAPRPEVCRGAAVLQNAVKLDSEIIYDRDFDYDYFGFKVRLKV